MSGNTFGKIFKITTFGESHGTAMGCILDGCPPQIELKKEDIQHELDRRKPGQSDVTTQRKEDDAVEILSGVFEGKTLGTPIGMIIYNKDQQSKDYSNIKDVFRPNHADITYQAKYGHRDYRGGGRASARETVNWVAAGAIAKKILQEEGISVNGFVSEIGKVKAEKINNGDIVLAVVDGDFTVKRYRKVNDSVFLYPENKSMKPIKIFEGSESYVWGKVMWSFNSVG